MPTKYLLLLLADSADEPVAALDGRTPLETARTPNLDAIARRGRIGTARVIPELHPPADDVAIVSLLGYDPRDGYTGCGPVEAIGRRILLARGEVAYRCDFVTVADGALIAADAGGLATRQAADLAAFLNPGIADHGARLSSTRDHQCLLIVRDADQRTAICVPPREIEGQAIAAHRPHGAGAERLRAIMRHGEDLLPLHDVNLVRRDLGENPANAVWPWGGGRLPRWRRFRQRYGLRGAAVGSSDFLRGVAVLLGWPFLNAANPSEIAAAAIDALSEFDLVVMYVETAAADSLRSSPHAKVRAIEETDAQIVAPLSAALAGFEHHRILAACTTVHSVERRQTTAAPIPFCLAGAGVNPDGRAEDFNETAAKHGSLDIPVGNELMEYFLRI